MKNPLKQHALTLLVSIALVLVSACLYLYLYEETQALVGRAIDARSVVLSDLKNRAQGKDLLSVYQTTAASRASLPGLFVPADNAVVFIQTVESMGQSSGAAVTISSIASSPSAGKAPGAIGTVTAHISASGSWESVMRTLSLFEAFPYRSAINHVTLSASTLSTDKAAKGRAWMMSFDIAASTLITPARQPQIPVSSTTTP